MCVYIVYLSVWKGSGVSVSEQVLLPADGTGGQVLRIHVGADALQAEHVFARQRLR